MGEGAQDVTGFAVTPGDQGEPFERDHGVAPPVGEPVVSGDDGLDLVARGMGAGDVLDAAGRRDDELVGGEDELGGGAGVRLLVGDREQAAPALHLRFGGIARRHRREHLQVFGRGDQGGGMIGREIQAEITGDVEVAADNRIRALLRVCSEDRAPCADGD